MQTKIPILASLTILTFLAAIPFSANLAHANSGLPINDPNNTWTPNGPGQGIQHVLLKYYSSDSAEYFAFQNGGTDGIDIADSGVASTGPPFMTWPSYDSNVDFNISAVQGGPVWNGIYFNGGSSTWSKWGCDWQFYNSPCGIEMRQAFAHLIDRQAFIAAHLGGCSPLPPACIPGGVGGTAIYDDVPANKVLANGAAFQSLSSNFCTWDSLNNTGCNSSTGPYHLGSNSFTGFAQPGSPDFCVAADHMIRALKTAAGNTGANPTIAKDPKTCVLSNYSSAIINNPLRGVPRSAQPRRALALGFAATLNALFGATVNRFIFCQLSCSFPIVFSEPPVSPVDDWDWYTYGYQDTSPFPTYLFTQFSSQFSYTGPLGGAGTGQASCTTGASPAAFTGPYPTNNIFVCIAPLDNALSAAVSTGSETSFDNSMLSALNIAGKYAVTLPMYTLNVRTPALRSVTGLTNARGVGYDTTRELLSAHRGPYNPIMPRFVFDGGGTDTIRWGQAQPIDFLNPFNAQTVWEFNTLFLVYDTLFASNPVIPGQVYCEMCQDIQTAMVGGNTQFTVNLRQNLRFQDGTIVTARDVKFSLLNLRDFSSMFTDPSVLLSVQACDSPVCVPAEVTITMRGQNVSHLLTLSTIPILPRHLWGLPGDRTYGDVGQVDPAKADPAYDPVTNFNLIGSGPYQCDNGVKVGGGCTFDSGGLPINGQSVPPGGSTRLDLFDNTQGGPLTTGDPFNQYTRLNNPSWGSGANTIAAQSGQFNAFLWADKDDQDLVGPAAIASAESCFGATSTSTACPDYAYWLQNGLHPSTPGKISTEVDLVELYAGDSGVRPYTWGGDPGGIGPLTNIVAYPS